MSRTQTLRMTEAEQVFDERYSLSSEESSDTEEDPVGELPSFPRSARQFLPLQPLEPVTRHDSVTLRARRSIGLNIEIPTSPRSPAISSLGSRELLLELGAAPKSPSVLLSPRPNKCQTPKAYSPGATKEDLERSESLTSRSCRDTRSPEKVFVFSPMDSSSTVTPTGSGSGRMSASDRIGRIRGRIQQMSANSQPRSGSSDQFGSVDELCAASRREQRLRSVRNTPNCGSDRMFNEFASSSTVSNTSQTEFPSLDESATSQLADRMAGRRLPLETIFE